MGLESSLRGWAIRSGMQDWPWVVGLYNRLNLLRFRRKWDEPVAFQGAEFSIGKDLSLYPAVRNGAFEATDYPSQHSIRDKFRFRLDYAPVPDAGDFRISVGPKRCEPR